MIYPEEITHCAAGVKWFKYLNLRFQEPVLNQKISISQESETGETEITTSKENEDVIQKFHVIVRTYFRGPLKPPFNELARDAAGFGRQWYEPLAFKVANEICGLQPQENSK